MRRGIATTYKGVRFRSRIEARWARFFDRINWTWDYEPFDLDGYIPDFILTLHEPVLVEVKSALTLAELKPYASKIQASGWDHESIIVGASVPLRDADGVYADIPIGWHYDHWGMWGVGGISWCVDGDHLALLNGVHSCRCRVCGAADGDHHIGGLDEIQHTLIDVLWTECGNDVQWRPPEAQRKSSWAPDWSVRW